MQSQSVWTPHLIFPSCHHRNSQPSLVRVVQSDLVTVGMVNLSLDSILSWYLYLFEKPSSNNLAPIKNVGKGLESISKKFSIHILHKGLKHRPLKTQCLQIIKCNHCIYAFVQGPDLKTHVMTQHLRMVWEFIWCISKDRGAAQAFQQTDAVCNS